MRILNWFRRGKLENGLDRELRYHFDRRVDDLVKSGLTEAAARRAARLELGGLTQVREEVRDVWLTRWLREFLYDLRFSARTFRRSPSFSTTAVLSLALGIGAMTAIYSLVDQVLLRMLPVQEPERLVLLDWNGDSQADGWGSGNLMSYPICRDLDQQHQFFDDVFCRHPRGVNFSTGNEPKSAAAEMVSGNFFSVLGVRPALGRLFTAEDDVTPGAHPWVVLSHDFWANQLGKSPDVIGRKVLVNQHPMTVIGVAAEGFQGVDIGEVPAFWIPAMLKRAVTPGWDRLLDRRARWMHVFGRLKPGMTLAQAKAGLQPWFKAMLHEDVRGPGFPAVTAEQRQGFLASTLELTPATQGRSGLRSRLTTPLRVLFAATAVLLALACLNVAGLFLARGSAREREISTRLALGASRERIGRQLLTDSFLFALVGGVLGVILAQMMTRTLIAFLPRGSAAIDLDAAIDSRLLLFAFLVSAGAGMLSGMAPALQAGRDSLITSLRERGGTAFTGIWLRKAIVTLQIAFTLVLVIGAALFGKTLTGLMAKGPGFSTSRMVSFSLKPLLNGYSPARADLLIRRVHAELAAAPGTQSAAVASSSLLSGGSSNTPMTIQAHERMVTDRTVHINLISAGFFSTLGARIVAGRDFNEHDTLPPGESGRRSAIVNEAFVRRYFGTRSPIGSRIATGTGPDTEPDITIVGVVSDFSYRGLREETEQAYFPIFEGGSDRGTFYLRLKGTPDLALRSIRAIISRADSSLPIEGFRTLDEQVSRSLNTERMLATVSGGFGTLALLLSLVGLYGVMSFVVTQRTREIGVRLALGSSRPAALWLVLHEAIIMIAIGTAIALPCVWALGRVVESQLFGVAPTDAGTIVLATGVLAATAIAAAFIPAYRASNVSPTDALRFE